MKHLLHKIAHKLKWNRGRVESGWFGNHLWTWFECGTCGMARGGIQERHLEKGEGLDHDDRE